MVVMSGTASFSDGSQPQNGDGNRYRNGGPSTKANDHRPARLIDQLEHFTWTNFTFPMATGGLALLVSEQSQPYNFRGLQTIGKVVYIFDLFIFTVLATAITYRFLKFPGTFKHSLTDPSESLFTSTALLSLASITASISRYGIPACGPWLIVAYRVLFWVYFAITFCHAVSQYTVLFTSPLLRIENMTPAWDLPIFPFMLCGTVASAGAASQPPEQAMPMIIAGLAAQGLGMLVSMSMYAMFVWRLVQFGFPPANSRPSLFIAVGPPSFTALSLIGLANDYPSHYNYFGDDTITIQILQVIATMTSIFIWSLSLWFFCIALAGILAAWGEMTWHLTWWAFVFPNVGFTIAVIDIGKSLESPGVKWVGSAMSILLVALWIFLLTKQARYLCSLITSKTHEL